MKREINNAIASASINTSGAYVDTWEVNNTPIFFPKVMVKIDEKLKTRGGMHICAPNFGKDEITGNLSQHGFARDLEWEIIDESESSMSLYLDGIDDYEDVSFIIKYELDYSSFLASLKIINNSKSDKLVSPGFHPYFYADHKPIAINDVSINKDDLSDSVYNKDTNQKFIANGNDIEVLGLSNVYEYVFWSDFKGDYICVEPTYLAKAFIESDENPYILKPNEEFLQKIEIKLNN